MDVSRRFRWKAASTAALLIRPEAAGIVSTLGKIDADLYEKGECFRQLRRNIGNATPAQWDELHDSLSIAYLWVLGAYEIVRTLHQTLKSNAGFSHEIVDRCQRLKRTLERIRMPLAKLETPRIRHQSDYGVAYAAFNESQGIGWNVAKNDFISRDELGSALLEFLEFARACQRTA